MSDMNESLLKALRAIRLGDWVYGVSCLVFKNNKILTGRCLVSF
jgi:hypothetical protein